MQIQNAQTNKTKRKQKQPHNGAHAIANRICELASAHAPVLTSSATPFRLHLEMGEKIKYSKFL